MLSSTLPFPAEVGAPGPFTRESLTGAQDPLGGYKDQAELVWRELTTRFWQGQLGRVMDKLQKKGVKPPPAAKAKDPYSKWLFTEEFYGEEFWANENKQLLGVIGPQLQKDVYVSAVATRAQFEHLGVNLDWTMINADAAKWARQYAGKLIKGVNTTTRKAVGEAVGAWVETPGQTYQDLRASLMDLAYPARRAELIARTEVTRAYAQGSLITARNGEKWKTFPQFASLHRYYKTWQTKHDSTVCDPCAEMHLEEVEGTSTEFMTAAGPVSTPPLHPG